MPLIVAPVASSQSMCIARRGIVDNKVRAAIPAAPQTNVALMLATSFSHRTLERSGSHIAQSRVWVIHRRTELRGCSEDSRVMWQGI